MSIELIKKLTETGFSGLIVGVMLSLFYWIITKFVALNEKRLWEKLNSKDEELKQLNERVLIAFENNTKAIQKMIENINDVSKKNSIIENKLDRYVDRILDKINRFSDAN